jgi:predicted alpha-1,6-mannanase (GH76 family)
MIAELRSNLPEVVEALLRSIPIQRALPGLKNCQMYDQMAWNAIEAGRSLHA